MRRSLRRFMTWYSPGVGLSGVVALVLLALPVLRTIQMWGCSLREATILDYGPAQLALRVHLLVQGLPLYRDFRVPPYVPIVYGPVVPWVTAAMSEWFGNSVMASLEAGRLLTLFSTAAVCVLIFLLARRVGARWVSALLVVMAFVLTPLVQRWGLAFRVDMPDLACELLGLLLYAYGLALPAVAALVLGFFVKQGRVAAIAAIVLCSWLKGERRLAAKMAVGWLVGVGVIIAILQLTNPWYWLNSFEAIAVSHYDYKAPATFLALTVIECAGLVYLAVSGLALRRSRDLLSLCFLATAIVQDSLSSFRWGSYVYYFLPTVAALAILGARELDVLLEWAEQTGAAVRALLGAAAAAVLAFGFLVLPQTRITVLRRSFGPVFACQVAKRAQWNPAALKRLHRFKGPVYTDMASLMLADRSPNLRWIDLMVLHAMQARGSFDDRALISSIKERRVAAFALDEQLLRRDWRGQDFFWPELRGAIKENYVVANSAGLPFLMVPRKASPDSVGSR